MHNKIEPGLGELLRYVSELVEFGAQEHYQQMGLKYKARYTPVLRAIRAGAQTVTDITSRTHLTQGAISQTVAQMEKDGVISRHSAEDARRSMIELTPLGKTLVNQLNSHWAATFEAIEQLESEIGYPLRKVLEYTAHALEEKGFSQRLTDTKHNLEQEPVDHV